MYSLLANETDLKHNYMYYKPFDYPLKDYEGHLRRREFWDDYGAEWHNKTVEQKLIILAGFVQKGGNLKKVINKYAKDRDEMYRERIQHCILLYILQLMLGDELSFSCNLATRVKRLDRDGLVNLLSYLLKTCVMEKELFINYDIKKCWVVEYNNKLTPDEVLDKFDKKFFRSHPEISYMTFYNRAEVWWNPHYSLW